jgi:hypothetical protein
MVAAASLAVAAPAGAQVDITPAQCATGTPVSPSPISLVSNRTPFPTLGTLSIYKTGTVVCAYSTSAIPASQTVITVAMTSDTNTGSKSDTESMATSAGALTWDLKTGCVKVLGRIDDLHTGGTAEKWTRVCPTP